MGQDAGGERVTAVSGQPKLSWGEKRELRRRRRRRFEEVLGWILVPALIYVGYLVYQAVGGLPPEVTNIIGELLNSAAAGRF